MHIDGAWLKDDQGRTLMLRGVNLGGSSKVPYRPDGATCNRDGFFDHYCDVSFVGRPFPLAEADEHLARLRAWGLTFVRLLVTWEAIEHRGPGVYDEEYLDYLYQVVRKAGDYGISLFVDPHQDVWSRFSGGDGAPGWTFDAIGMDVTRFAATGAAIVHATHGDPFPRMIWPSNGAKLAAATMFTLFFAGDDFAPQARVDGEPVQQFLQGHYIDAVKQVAGRLRGLPNVVGYDTLNEPGAGYIGCTGLDVADWALKMGEVPTPFQSMLLGAGYPQEVEVWEMHLTGPRRVGRRLVNPEGVTVWRPGYADVWRQHGVWDVDAEGRPQLLHRDYFAHAGERLVSFAQDYYRPFSNRLAQAIRSVDPDALIFVEASPTGAPPRWGPEDAPNIVYAPHWYDITVLIFKDFNPYIALDQHGHVIVGPGPIARSFDSQLAHLKREAEEFLGGPPRLIGEFGIAFDMKNKRAYRTGDWRPQVAAMDRSLKAMEANLLSCTLWNYTADNSNRRGDQWNDEDFSIFSRDQQTDPADLNSGGRALEAVVRPYARCTAGEPMRMSFDIKRRLFEFEFRHDPAVSAPTEIYVPSYQYPNGYAVEVTDGTYEIDQPSQTLTYRHSDEWHIHEIRIRPR